MKKTLRNNYIKAVNAYVDVFISKHFDDDADYFWIGDEVGGLVEINDYVISFLDIVRDIDEDVPKEMFFEYYDYSVEVKEYLNRNINYSSYIKGLRFNSLDKVKELRQEINKLLSEIDKDNTDET